MKKRAEAMQGLSLGHPPPGENDTADIPEATITFPNEGVMIDVEPEDCLKLNVSAVCFTIGHGLQAQIYKYKYKAANINTTQF